MGSVQDEHQFTARDIWKARHRTKSIIRHTPLIQSPFLSEKNGACVRLKLETLQEIGAFKVRGAANKILSLSSEEQKKGVTTFSTGNHGLAVAYVANQLGIRAIICISNRVPKGKVDAIRSFGAQIAITGESQDDAEAYCYRLQDEDGLTVIKPFDDRAIIAGQGTIGLELLDYFPDLESVIVPLSGGGLLAGIGLAVKANDPSIQVIGVSMERSAVMYESLVNGSPVVLKEQDTLADSLLGGIGLDNHYTFDMVKSHMDEVVLVSEESIANAMGFMLSEHHMITEGAAAVGVAALLEQKDLQQTGNTAVIISGHNVDASVVREITNKYIRE